MLIVCFHVLELLIDEAAMPKGMQVYHELLNHPPYLFSDTSFLVFSVCGLSLVPFLLCIPGFTAWEGLFLCFWSFRSSCTSHPYIVSFTMHSHLLGTVSSKVCYLYRRLIAPTCMQAQV